MTTKQKCAMCDWCGSSDDVLKAPNPFDADDTLWFCPNCKAAECLYLACDEPGCNRETSCGTPTPNGYRSTCGEHRPKP